MRYFKVELLKLKDPVVTILLVIYILYSSAFYFFSLDPRFQVFSGTAIISNMAGVVLDINGKLIFLIIVIIFLREANNDFLKAQIGNGYTREEIFSAKLVMVLFLAITVTLAEMLRIFSMCIFTEYGVISTPNFLLIMLRNLIYCGVAGIVGLFVSVFQGKTLTTIVLVWGWSFMEGILSLVDSMFVHNDFSSFLPLNLFSNIISAEAADWPYTIAGVVLSVILLWFSFLKFRKSEIT